MYFLCFIYLYYILGHICNELGINRQTVLVYLLTNFGNNLRQLRRKFNVKANNKEH